jgi:hypothetical protein
MEWGEIMRYLKIWMLAMLAVLLSACGGGGNPGSTSAGSGSGTGTTGATIAVTLVNNTGTVLTVNAINKSSTFYAKAVVTSATGAVLANQLVTFSTDYTLATLAGNATAATALTDSAGVATVLISPLTLTTTGAATLTASATVSSVAVTSNLNFSTSASNVSLTGLATAPSTIGALGTSAVTVVGSVNGVAASGVVVTFSATCGTFSPSTVTTKTENGVAGVASATYQSVSGCGASAVSLTASATGATPVSGVINVTAARAANIVFSSATPALMYASSAASGSKTSVVKFQVLDSSSAGLASQSVVFTLSNAAISSGVMFSQSGTTSTAAQTVTTDSSGFASITVASGTLPTTVSVTATLASDSTIAASSLGLVVTTGAATQNSASLSATKLSIEAWNTDGITTLLTMRVADRLGNPVPNGTSVNFVATAGLVTGSCTTVASACSVTYTSQGTRPVNGRVAILAYLDGEESFVDINGDNIWQPGETFYDAGKVYIDENEDGAWVSGEQIIDTSTNSAVCVNTTNTYPAIANTCDSTWSSAIRVRKQAVITLATSNATIECVTRSAGQPGGYVTSSNCATVPGRSRSGFTVFVHDTNLNGNSRGNQFGASALYNAMPTGTTVSASITTTGATCTVTAVSPNVVLNSPNGDLHDIVLSGAADCASVNVAVTVASPAGSITTQPYP